VSNTSLDFSKIEALRPLARLVGRIQDCSSGTPPFVIAGAQARDLLLKYGYDIDTGRQTADVDFAFRVSSWDEFEKLRKALVESGDFVTTKSLHKLRFRGKIEVDILPFGESIERGDRTIAWPPEEDFVMSSFGFREAFDSSLSLALPEDVKAKVVSVPGLALLKLVAWSDRRLRVPGKDAHDLLLIIRNYLDVGNSDRLHSEFTALLEEPDFDYENAGAYILGCDIAAFLDEAGRQRVGEILDQEARTDGRLRLVGDMRIEADRGVALLTRLRRGFEQAAGSSQQ
jgi:predicted nucleotidyltransferase